MKVLPVGSALQRVGTLVGSDRKHRQFCHLQPATSTTAYHHHTRPSHTLRTVGVPFLSAANCHHTRPSRPPRTDEVLAARGRLQQIWVLRRALEALGPGCRVLAYVEGVFAASLEVAAPARVAAGREWGSVPGHPRTGGPPPFHRTRLMTGAQKEPPNALPTLKNARASRPIWLAVARHRLRLNAAPVVTGRAVLDAKGVCVS
jgi:hypothetical protein